MPEQDGISQNTSSSQEQLPENETVDERLLQTLSAESFDDWLNERQYRRNIENGTPYFNESGHIPDPERHSPSKLLQCHRKIRYRQENTPAEQASPDGIFWVGTQFEEEIGFPFLERAVTGSDTYVQNTIWVDFTVETAVGDLRIKGATDPVIVDAEATPILPTEIKTKSSVEDLTSPNRHHKAQLHAYLVGLSEKYDINLRTGVLMYGSRDSLNTRFFIVEFDDTFWEEVVVGWAATHTEYRLANELPPAEPEYDWECEFCSFRERCGKGALKFEDIGAKGLLPGFTEYPKSKLVEYLEAHDDAKLTPSLAYEHPELVGAYGAFDWKCRGCSETVAWNAVEWDGDAGSPPTCPTCSSQGPVTCLVGPAPADQLVSEGDDK
mgnify:CR=1 FL=1